MDDLKKLVVETAVKKMLSKGYFDICTVRDILEITGARPSSEDMALLNALHCVNYGDMPPELLRGMPVLLQRVLQAPALEMDYKFFGSSKGLIEVN